VTIISLIFCLLPSSHCASFSNLLSIYAY